LYGFSAYGGQAGDWIETPDGVNVWQKEDDENVSWGGEEPPDTGWGQ